MEKKCCFPSQNAVRIGVRRQCDDARDTYRSSSSVSKLTTSAAGLAHLFLESRDKDNASRTRARTRDCGLS